MKKIMVTLLILVLTFAVGATPAMAAGYLSGGSDNIYQPGRLSGGGPLYTDVGVNYWAFDAINRCKSKGWFKGYPDGSFRPNAEITRAEAVKVFVDFLGLEVTASTGSDFYDVKAKDWYAAYVEAGKDLIPTHTTIQGKIPFNPDKPITREDTVYALVKALGCESTVGVPDLSVLYMFKDKSSISDSVKTQMAIALNENLVTGFNDGTIRAQEPLTRAQFATILARGSEHGIHEFVKNEEPVVELKIKIYNYPDETTEHEVKVNGLVKDSNIKTVDLLCNGKDVFVSDDGTFAILLNLQEGINRFKFTATNQKGDSIDKAITILRVKAADNTEDKLTETNEAKDNTCDPSMGIDAGRNDDVLSEGTSSNPSENEVGDENGASENEIEGFALSGFTNISGDVSQSFGNYTDNYGNRYNTYFDCGAHRWISKNKLEYLLDNKYESFKGVIYVPHGETGEGHGIVQIMGDGKVLYTSPDMTKISRPVHFNTDIKDVNDLVVQFETSNITLCLGEALVYANK